MKVCGFLVDRKINEPVDTSINWCKAGSVKAFSQFFVSLFNCGRL
jgi:hypothetical protein